MQVYSNSPEIGYIQWEEFCITYKGETYDLPGGYTDCLYVWWECNTPYYLQGANSLPSLTEDDIIVFLNKNGIYFVVPNTTILDGSLIVPESIMSDSIAANQITGIHIVANSIDTSHISVDGLDANVINVSDISALSSGDGYTRMVGHGISCVDDENVLRAFIGQYEDGKYGAFILDGEIYGDAIVAGSITSAHLDTGAVTADAIAANAIGAEAIAAGAVTADAIAANAIGAGAIAAGAITTDKLNAEAVTTEKIASGAVTATQIAADAITAAKINVTSLAAISANLGTVTAGAIDASKVTITNLNASNISSGTLSADRIAANAITAAKINVTDLATISADLGTVTAGAIDASKVSVTNLNASNISSGTLSADRIAANAITADKIDVTSLAAISANLGTVTAGAIDASKVTITNLNASNISSGTLSADRIAANAITAAKINVTDLATISADLGTVTAGAIDASKVSVTNLNASNISSGTLSADRIAANAITADKIDVTSLAAISANLGTVTAGAIDASKVTITNLNASNISSGTLNAARIASGTITSNHISANGISASKIKGDTLTLGGANNINGELSIKSADNIEVVRGNNDGIRVDGGSYLIHDKGMDMSLEQLPNLIPDHSFECVEPTGNVGTYGDFEIVQKWNYFDWRKTGEPRLLSDRNSSFTGYGFGLQCAVCNNTNYLSIVQPNMVSGANYFISGFACRSERNLTAGTAYFTINFLGASSEIVSTVNKSFTLNPGVRWVFDWERVGFVITIPSDSYSIEICVRSTDANYVCWDGIQLVEGNNPVRYEPEENLWRHMFGVTGLPIQGHIVESGGNANGDYIRFSNGTQICWYRGNVTFAINTAYGSIYRSPDISFYYPVSFTGYVNASPGQTQHDGERSWGTTLLAATQYVNIVFFDAVARTSKTTNVSYVAIGRWK